MGKRKKEIPRQKEEGEKEWGHQNTYPKYLMKFFKEEEVPMKINKFDYYLGARYLYDKIKEKIDTGHRNMIVDYLDDMLKELEDYQNKNEKQ